MSSKLNTGLESPGRNGSGQLPPGSGVPGCFSPRPTHSRNLSTECGLSRRDTTSKTTLDASASKHQSLVVGKEGGEKFVNASSKAQFEESPSPSYSQAPTAGGDSFGGGSTPVVFKGRAGWCREHVRGYPSPIETLVEHQRFRCSFGPRSGDSVDSFAPDRDARRAIEGVENSRILPPVTSGNFSLRQSYVFGRPWSSVVGLYGDTSRFTPWYISSLAASSSGEHVAIGDRSGRVFVMQRSQNEEDNKDEHERGSQGCSTYASRLYHPYEFFAGRQAYTSIIDPLNNVEVTPNVQATCFLPQVGASTYLLTANEKLPKLYKVMTVRESPAAFLAASRLGDEGSLSLTLNPPNGVKTNTMKQVARYALNHEYNINSLCSQADGTQFFSADDLTVKLWCVEYPDTSIETYSVKPPYEEDAQEMICAIHSFPHEPFLLFVVSLSGTVRVVDTRQTIKWLHQSPVTFRSTVCEGDTTYATTLLDCALSPCGRYIAGRDTTSVCLWDVRRAGSSSAASHGFSLPAKVGQDKEHDVVCRWELNPHLRRQLEQFFQGSTIERFHVRFLNDREICTGGFAGTLHIIDTVDTDSSNPGAALTNSRCSSAKAVKLPRLQSEGDEGSGPLKVIDRGAVSLSTAGEAEGLLSHTVKHLSPALTSYDGECCMLASCGPVFFQVAYSNFSN